MSIADTLAQPTLISKPYRAGRLFLALNVDSSREPGIAPTQQPSLNRSIAVFEFSQRVLEELLDISKRLL